jgi:hypothetical protein
MIIPQFWVKISLWKSSGAMWCKNERTLTGRFSSLSLMR